MAPFGPSGPQDYPNPRPRRLPIDAYTDTEATQAQLLGNPSNVAVVAIAGVVVTSRIRTGSVSIEDVLNQPKQCQFRLDGTAPTVGQDVKIGLGDLVTANLIFVGVVTSVSQGYEGKRENLVWQVHCDDYTVLLNSKRPIKSYSSQSATLIAKDLISTFTSGFTANNVQGGLASVEIAFDGRETLMQGLFRLARLVACYVRLDFARDLYCATTEPGDNPYAITDARPPLNDPPITYDSDLSQVRTRVYVYGQQSTIPVATPAGSTILPIDPMPAFSASGGSVLVSGSTVQKLTYTACTFTPTVTAPASAPTLADGGAGGGLTVGATYQWAYTWTTAGGETVLGPSASRVASATGTVNLSAIVIPDDPTVTDKNLYRTKANGSSFFKLPTQPAGRTAISWVDGALDSNLGTAAPVTSTAGPDLQTGSTTTGIVAAGSTTVAVADVAKFTSAGAVLSNGQFITFTGKSTTSGAGNLTGVPATGPGAVNVALPSGAIVTNLPCLSGIPSSGAGAISAQISAGDTVTAYVQRDDAAAQAVLAAAQGGDGIVEYVIDESLLASVTAMNARGDADLALFSTALVTVRYATRDVRTKSGKTVTMNLSAPTSISGTFKISHVSIDQIDLAAGRMAPRFRVEASSARFDLADLLRQLLTRAA